MTDENGNDSSNAIEKESEDLKSEETNKKVVTIGVFFGIKYYLRYYKISLSPTFQLFMSQTYDKGYDKGFYKPKENRDIKKLIDLILYKNQKPIEEFINFGRKKKKKLRSSLLAYLK
jgi:hypothetical protein